MMHSTIFKVVGAILVVLAVLMFLFRGLGPTQPAPVIHSTLPSGSAPGK
jgi:hypothetical protein